QRPKLYLRLTHAFRELLTIDTFPSADWKRKSTFPSPDAARSTSDLPRSVLALLWPFLPWPRRPYVAVAIPPRSSQALSFPLAQSVPLFPHPSGLAPRPGVAPQDRN